MSEWIEIGTIVAAHGLRGEVRVYPNSDFPERFLEPGMRWLLPTGQTEPEPVEFLGGYLMPSKGIYVVELAGVETREQAEALQGSQLFVTEQDRPHLEDDEFYVIDLLGSEVFDQATGTLIGKVVNIIPAGNDLLEVELNANLIASKAETPEPVPDAKTSKSKKQRKPPQAKTILIPFVKEIVPMVDLQQKRLEITPPKGLLELEHLGEESKSKPES